MQIPLEITFHDVDRSEWSDRFIRRQVDRLERYADDIVACRVTVARPHRHQHTGQAYHVRVEVKLPPHNDLVAAAEPVQVPTTVELRTVIRDAFKAMERQLLRSKDRRRGDVKLHLEPRALVIKLFADLEYGFLRSPEGDEIYFHKNAVLHGDFERLAIGTEVRFEAEMGDNGWQASSVQIVNKPGVRSDLHAPRRADIPPDWQA